MGYTLFGKVDTLEELERLKNKAYIKGNPDKSGNYKVRYNGIYSRDDYTTSDGGHWRNVGDNCGRSEVEYIPESYKELGLDYIRRITMNNLPNLKPCPYCGGSAYIEIRMGNQYVAAHHSKKCFIKPDTWLQSAETLKKQIKGWNRRMR